MTEAPGFSFGTVKADGAPGADIIFGSADSGSSRQGAFIHVEPPGKAPGGFDEDAGVSVGNSGLGLSAPDSPGPSDEGKTLFKLGPIHLRSGPIEIQAGE